MSTSHVSGPFYSANGFVGPTYTYATLPVVANYPVGSTVWTSDRGVFVNNGTKWVSVSPATPSPIETTPIMGVIAHSFGTNTVNKYQIINASVNLTDNAGTIQIKTQLSFNLSVNDVIKVYGLGFPYDGVWSITALSQPGGYATYTYVNSAAAGLPTGTSIPTPGSAYAYCASQVGNNAGYYGAGGIAWAMVLAKRAFCVPPSYILCYSGGTLIGGGDDPGLAGNVTNMLAKSPLPQYVYIDLGINDCTSTTITLAQMQSTVSTNIPRLIAAGIIPVIMGVRPVQTAYSGTLTALQVNKKTKQYNKWLNNYCKQIGAVYVDSNYLSRDVDSTNAAVGGDLAAIYADFVHVNCLGGKRDGLAIYSVLSKVLPPNATPALTLADAYDATYNKTGSITTAVSGTPGGIFNATVADTTLTGSAVQFNTIWASVSGAGTSAVTAGVRANTATASDGTLLPGYELVLKFGAGSGPRTVFIWPGSSNGLILQSSGVISGGDTIQAEMEISIPSSTVTTGVTYTVPSITLTEKAETPSGVFANQIIGAFLAGNTIVASQTNDIAYEGVVATPVLTVRSSLSTGGTIGITPLISVGVSSGTLGAGPYTVIIRSITLRKVDPVYGEPF